MAKPKPAMRAMMPEAAAIEPPQPFASAPSLPSLPSAPAGPCGPAGPCSP